MRNPAIAARSPRSSIRFILEPVEKDLGGFSVRRLLPASEVKAVGPFVFFDHLGPARFAPGEGIDVRPHPHIGLATITYLFEGEILHRDSLGSIQADPAARDQLDDRRAGDRTFRTHPTAGPLDRAHPARAAIVGGVAGCGRRNRAGLFPLRRDRRCQRCTKPVVRCG